MKQLFFTRPVDPAGRESTTLNSLLAAVWLDIGAGNFVASTLEKDKFRLG